MNLLAVDTCSGPSAALAFNGSTTSISDLDPSIRAEGISEVVTKLLSDGNATWSKLNGLIVGSGPGSFTGLRLSLGFMKGVSSALKLPLIGVASFQGIAAAFALGAPDLKGELSVIADARREELFLQRFVLRGPKLIPIPISEPEIIAKSLAIPILAKSIVTLTCDPEFTVSHEMAVKVVLIKDVARGLLECAKTMTLSDFSLEHLSSLQPRYLREVAAKTIAQRAVSKGG